MYSANLENLLKSLKVKESVAEPLKQEPVKQEPVKQEPVKQEPVKQEPVKQEPVKQEPVKPDFKPIILPSLFPNQTNVNQINTIKESQTNQYITYFSPTAPAKRVLLVSTHCHQFTGYSKVSWNLLKNLSTNSKFQLFHYGFQQMVAVPPGFRPYPSNVEYVSAYELEKKENGLDEGGFGFTPFVKYVEKIKPDIIIIYNDAFIISKYIQTLQKVSYDIRNRVKIIAYVDQVFYSQKAEHMTYLNQHVDHFFAFSKFWKDKLVSHGITKPIGVLCHGMDYSVNPRLTKADARQKINIPNETLLLMNVNRNTVRKRYDLVILAFAEIISKYPTRDIRMFCVCDGGQRGGYPLMDIYVNELKKHGLVISQHINKLLQIANDLTHNDEVINAIYNCADIGLTCAEAEGFGLCTFEMMGLGIPQVVPEHGAYLEYCNKDNSIIVPAKHVYYIPNSNSNVAGEARCVDPHDVAVALNRYISDPSLMEKNSIASVKTVEAYTWESVMREFINVLTNM